MNAKIQEAARQLRDIPQQAKGTVVDDMAKPVVVLLYSQKYALAALVTIISSMAFVVSLSVRAMANGCVHYLLGINNATQCLSGVLEGMVSMAIIFACCIIILKVYVLGRHVSLPLNNML